ncbi:MAG: phosphoribosylformylglycinamidine cyclo-ligase [Pseudomonadota bacterium]|nr:phosphoribosylformylglycinamidine cyclo-ligase [Pseudomonadota bacterium]
MLGNVVITGPTYKDSGVDIDAASELVEYIKPLARATKTPGAIGSLGGFGGLFDLKAAGYIDPMLVAATDGVGTKLNIAMEMGAHSTIGIDLVAMCVNDLIVQGAEPLFFLDYFATGRLNNTITSDVISGISSGCKQARCALIGGETAEMPGMYGGETYDLAGFAVGAVERGSLLPQSGIGPGDVILGLASSGLHSNGFSLVRHILANKKIRYPDQVPFPENISWGQYLLTPTRIYVNACLDIHRAGLVKAFAHITGGGLSDNIPRILPAETAAALDPSSWDTLPIYRWLATEGGVASEEMTKAFNCGIGMVAIVAPDDATSAKELMEKRGEKVWTIGQIVKLKGDKRVEFSDLPLSWDT